MRSGLYCGGLLHGMAECDSDTKFSSVRRVHQIYVRAFYIHIWDPGICWEN